MGNYLARFGYLDLTPKTQGKMGRRLTPILRREFENLNKDADSRKSAMKALKSYMKDLDSKSIPIFLADVSQAEQTGILPRDNTISLYELLAQIHGPNIVPQIDNIMNSIVKTLSLSMELHQACAKVVTAIDRYAIVPTSWEDGKRRAIHSLCKPLSDSLLSTQENLSSGAALCTQALVESDNWRFFSSKMINEFCLRVVDALENHLQTCSHMALVTTLAEHNSLIVGTYGRLLIRSGLRILYDGFTEDNSQKQLSAIRMISSLLKYLDPRSLFSELEMVIRELENFETYHRNSLVSISAVQPLLMAERIFADSKFDMDTTSGSSSGSSTSSASMDDYTFGEESPDTASPELKYDGDIFFFAKESQGCSESVSSKNDVFRANDPMLLAAEKAVPGHNAQPERVRLPALRNSSRSIAYSLFAVLFAVLLCSLAKSSSDDRNVLLPT